MGYDDWNQLKIWILLYPEACIEDRHSMGAGSTISILYDYFLIEP